MICLAIYTLDSTGFFSDNHTSKDGWQLTTGLHFYPVFVWKILFVSVQAPLPRQCLADTTLCSCGSSCGCLVIATIALINNVIRYFPRMCIYSVNFPSSTSFIFCNCCTWVTANVPGSPKDTAIVSANHRYRYCNVCLQTKHGQMFSFPVFEWRNIGWEPSTAKPSKFCLHWQ